MWGVSKNYVGKQASADPAEHQDMEVVKLRNGKNTIKKTEDLIAEEWAKGLEQLTSDDILARFLNDADEIIEEDLSRVHFQEEEAQDNFEEVEIY